jgi:hypothetical protein
VEAERALVPLARRAAIGALAADIAHDAGNALFGLVGLIGLIREGEPVSGRGRGLLLGAGDDLDEALRPLLRFARAGDDDGVRADLTEVVEEALALYVHGDRKQLELDRRVPASPVRVTLPPSAALQAVVHLLLAADPVERIELAGPTLTIAPARDESLDELVAGRIAADAGGSLVRDAGALVLRLPPA